MIQIVNPTKLTSQAFFQDLIAYLDQHENVTLREIKREFSQEKQIDRKIEEFIKVGYILRKEKRYYLTLPFLESLENLELDQEIFIREESPLYEDFCKLPFWTEVKNDTNAVMIKEKTGFQRKEATLSNYFYKLRKGYTLSSQQEQLYALLGDVNPEYALKYMTTFLLKYARKDELVQKRPDIFVESLVLLGYVVKNSDEKYLLNMDFDKERLIFTAR